MSAMRLLADIGGTNARFARAIGNDIGERRTYAVGDYSDFASVLAAYLAETGGAEGLCAAAVAAAGPLRNDAVVLTNAPWTINGAETSRELGGVPVCLMNDLEAVALALPHLGAQDVCWLGKEGAVGGRERMLALNVGTGFGAASVMNVKGTWIALASEAGHMSLGARDALELQVLEDPRGRTRTVEEALSGEGLKRLYRASARRAGGATPAIETAADIFARAGDEPVAGAALRQFTVLLGRVAGDLVLAATAWGGVYLCGSVARAWMEVADIGLFRQDFEDREKMAAELAETPSALITRDEPALLGLALVPLDAD